MYCNLLTDIRIARETGYEGIEIIGSKLYRYLDHGFTPESLLPHLEGLTVVAMGYVQDIERQEPEEYAALLEECEKMCALAQKLGAAQVQVLTGPIEPGLGLEASDSYKRIMELPWPELMKSTAENLATLADMAASYDLSLYLEPLTWTRMHTLEQALELIDAAERDNVGLLIDFWHHWTSGTTPDDIAKLDKNLIAGVHFCDSLPLVDGPVTHDLREVWTGGGNIPLKEWVDAVTSTGYDRWMAAELFSSKHWEMDPWRVARNLAEMMKFMLV
jgi:sugar phosphate isomerase/epimerase